LIDAVPSPWNQVIKTLAILAGLVYLLIKTVKFVPQGQKAMRMRFSKVAMKNGQPIYLDAGMHILFPFVHNLECVSVLDRTFDLKSTRLRYAPFDVVDVSATVTFSVIDIFRVRYAVDDFEARLTAACEARLRVCIHETAPTATDEKTEEITDAFRLAIETTAIELGVAFKDLNITNAAPDAQFAIAGAIQQIGRPATAALEAIGLPINGSHVTVKRQ